MEKEAESLLGTQFRKIDPKLRMIANGDEKVNVLRAEHNPALAAPESSLARKLPMARSVEAVPVQAGPDRVDLTPTTLQKIPKRVLASVFVYTTDTCDADTRVPGETACRGHLRTATVPLANLPKVAEAANVNFVEMGQPLAAPRPVVTDLRPPAPTPEVRRVGLEGLHRYGEDDVLIGIIDCEGFDFAHPDFRDADGGTRWLAIWDQGGDTRKPPSKAAPLDYGAEFLKEHLDAAVKQAAQAGVAPQDLEPQSQMVPGSHGTHVASIAAGNLGVARKAMIAGVLIALTEDDEKRRTTFCDSARLAHAVEYLIALAAKHHRRLAINISLGTNGHGHDGSAAICRWIDSALAVPGRAVCVAAGNAGQEKPEHEGDLGWIMGRIHTSGRLPAQELTTDIDWLVAGNGIADVSENELEIWYSPQDRFSVSVRPPGRDWIGPVQPGQFVENRQLVEDRTFVSVYNELYHPANGCNYIAIYLSPGMYEPVVGVPPGCWTVRLHGVDVRAGEYHAWIERDDPRPVGRLGPDQQTWIFPSFFSDRSNVDDHSVSSLACGQWVVSVANLDQASERVSISSSQGPTRDGRWKPDIAAPGTDIVAAKGFAGEDDLWVQMTGTSMASPYVTGVAGLMLAAEPALTGAQIVGILHRTGRPLPGGNYTWSNAAGFGAIDPQRCVEEARRVNRREDLTQ